MQEGDANLEGLPTSISTQQTHNCSPMLTPSSIISLPGKIQLTLRVD